MSCLSIDCMWTERTCISDSWKPVVVPHDFLEDVGGGSRSRLKAAFRLGCLVLESSGGFELLGAENIYYWALLRLCRLLLGTKGSYDAKMSLPNSSYT